MFTALDFSGQNILVNGHVLHIKDIKMCIETIISELRSIFIQDLFFGLSHLIDLDAWLPGIVHEEPRNQRPGYSCFVDPHNHSLSEPSSLLLRTVLDHPTISGRFHFLDQNSTLIWKAAPCLAYLEKCEAVEMLLFTATHMTVGEPPRGTEFASHCIHNIPGGNIRNVFIAFQNFCLMGTFNKSVAHHGSKIMRVPLPEIGRLWTIYISHVRPLVVAWQRYFKGTPAELRAQNNLFFGLHRPVTSTQLSQALAFHTSRILGIRITISLWRHIATWFLNHHAVKFQEHLAMANRATLATQMGHSEATHALYAADARLPTGIDFHTFFSSMKTSGIWHELLGFEPTLSLSMNSTASECNKGREQGASESQVQLSSSALTPQLAEQISASLIPSVLRLITHTRAGDLASVLDSINIKPQPPTSGTCSPAIDVCPFRLAHLRRFLGDPKGRFKTQQQAEVTEVLARADPSVMVIGPTGEGIILATGYWGQFI